MLRRWPSNLDWRYLSLALLLTGCLDVRSRQTLFCAGTARACVAACVPARLSALISATRVVISATINFPFAASTGSELRDIHAINQAFENMMDYASKNRSWGPSPNWNG